MNKLGVFVPHNKDIDSEFKKVADYGFSTCQVAMWNPEDRTDEMAEKYMAAMKKYGVEITCMYITWDHPCVFDFYSGPYTVGLVPETYRADRIKNVLTCSEFAKKLGVKNIGAHVGYIPENPNSTEYASLICALRSTFRLVKENGQNFLFETGQETPVTLLRAIVDIDLDNLGINLDPANLILYGKGNPIDALDIFGKYVMGIHAKDGNYPTDSKRLGREVKVGTGRVDFPQFLKKLIVDVGYRGPLTIEREISGEQQIQDIRDTREYLEMHLSDIYERYQ